jgi:protein arginine N-methyltransferase 5
MYVRYLHDSLPPLTKLEEFAQGYQDYLQTPLQPLEFNLESATYEIFEKDPVKYGNYEKAIEAALRDRPADKKMFISSVIVNNSVVAVVGAGRGPLVDRALKAAQSAGRQIEMLAVEKNPHAFIGYNVEIILMSGYYGGIKASGGDK